MIAGFSYTYEHSIVLQAELHALMDGLFLCCQLGLHEVEIEIDAEIIYKMLKGITPVAWELVYKMRHCRKLIDQVGTKCAVNEVGQSSLIFDHTLNTNLEALIHETRNYELRQQDPDPFREARKASDGKVEAKGYRATTL